MCANEIKVANEHVHEQALESRMNAQIEIYVNVQYAIEYDLNHTQHLSEECTNEEVPQLAIGVRSAICDLLKPAFSRHSLGRRMSRWIPNHR